MRYSYLARAPGGAQVEGFVDATSEQAAVRSLAADGVRVIDLKPADPSAAKRKKPRPISASGLEQPLSELAILLGGGVHVHSACESVARTAENSAAQQCFADISNRVRIGENFADAFAAAAPSAPASVKAIIRAGDTSGSLGPAIKEAADSLSFQGGLRREMISALIYPAVLLVSGVAATGFMTMTVIPKFASSIGPERAAELPAFTRAVFSISLWMNDNAGAVALIAGASVALISQAVRSGPVRAAIADFAVSTPLLKGFMLSFESARWSGLFAAMIDRRTPLLEAMSIARDGFASGRLQRQMLQAERAVRRGEAIAKALQAHTSLPPTLINLVAAGESSGDLAGAARNAAIVFQERARVLGRRMAALIEPGTVLIIGAFIGTLAVTMLTAISSVTATGLQ